MVSLSTVQPSLNQEFLCTLACQIIVQQILLFFGGKKTYTTLLGPTRLLSLGIFPSKLDFHLHKWEKILSTRLLISMKSATYTIKWSYTIIWQVRVCSSQIFPRNQLLKIDVTLKFDSSAPPGNFTVVVMCSIFALFYNIDCFEVGLVPNQL